MALNIPEFTADLSLYPSEGHYRTTGMIFEFQGDISANACAESKLGIVTGRDSLIIPMSQPGHKTDVSGPCRGCEAECLATWELGCNAAVAAGCAGFLAVPFAGPGLYAGCVAVGAAGCAAGHANCVRGCKNVGGACCPVACGPSCCGPLETCLDAAEGLCCSPGTLPCLGPQASCYDPKTEKCLPSGVGCPFGQECGNNCCGPYATCVDQNTGNCCPLLTGIPCGNQCCDALTQRCTNSGCCPTSQACSSICCPPGFTCGPNNQCVVAPTCQPGQFLCVSADGIKQNCCPGNEKCCLDGSCCGPGKVCCTAPLGCVTQEKCYR